MKMITHLGNKLLSILMFVYSLFLYCLAFPLVLATCMILGGAAEEIVRYLNNHIYLYFGISLITGLSLYSWQEKRTNKR